MSTIPSSQQLILKKQGKSLFSHQNVMRLETILGIVQRTLLKDLYYSTTRSNFLTNFFDFKTLGNGAFGTVIKVQKRPFHIGDEFDVLTFNESSYNFESEFAIKIIPNYKSDAATSEIKSLANLIHPNVVRCHSVWEEQSNTVAESGWNFISNELLHFSTKSSKYNSYDSYNSINSEGKCVPIKCLFLQYEFCSDGTLQDVLDSRDKLKWANGEPPSYYTAENKNIFLQILEALVYLQFQGVIHGDLKPDNIFIMQNGPIKVAKIGDFGLSQNVNEIFENYQSENFNAGLWKEFPRLYMPPENLQNIRSHKGDMYSFGLIFLTMLMPFDTVKKRRYAILNAMCPSKDRKYPLHFSQKFPHESEWIEKMLNHSIDCRPSALELRDIIYQLSIKNIVSDYNVIDYPETFQADGNFKAICIAMRFAEEENYIQAYRYLCPEFYTYFHRLKRRTNVSNTDTTSVFDILFPQSKGGGILDTFSNLSVKLNKIHDEFYRQSEILRFVRNNNLQDSLEMLFTQFRIIKIIKSIQEDSIYEQLVRSGLPDKNSYIKETLKTIEESSTYQNLYWKFDWKLEVEMVICQNLFKQGDRQSLEIALKKLIWVEQGIKENDQVHRDQMNSINFEMEPQQFHLITCRILRANIFHKLGRKVESKENFHWILESYFFVYKKGKNTMRLMPHILYHYADCILCPENRFETAVLYLQAGYEILSSYNGISYSYGDAEKLLLFLYHVLGLRADMEAFIKFELVETQRVKDFSMLSKRKSNESLFQMLLDSNIFYKDLEKMLGQQWPGFNFNLELSDLFQSKVKNSLGRRYESAEELVKYPPFDFVNDGWWHTELIFWAERFLQRVYGIKDESSSCLKV